MNLLILKKYTETVTSIIKDVFPSEWQINCINPEDCIEYLKDTDVIIPSHSVIDEKLLKNAPRLKIIQTGAGYDNVDIEACRSRGIRVFNAPSVNTFEVAEHTFAFIFSWYKKIDQLNSDIRMNTWSLKKEGKAFSDLTIGIIGFGNIGKKVCEIAAVFGMKIIVYSSHMKTGVSDNIIFTDNLDYLLSRSDIVSVHTSASPDKINMFSDREFSLMKNDSFFINTSRGSLVDEDALCRALDNKHIAGAGLDVFNAEPLPEESRLRNYSNIIMTPHCAGEPDLYNSYKKRFEFFYENIVNALENRDPEGFIA